MFGMGPWELALIFLVILLLFGAKRLPDIAQGLGKGIREFKSAVKDTQNEIKSSVGDSEKKDKNSNDKKDG
ncbi:MAG: twin-arginine translocase TatA/TatE family subunit [Candidatus Zixiibacteriota bacterium]|nr:MAG: twin-arginine translocase TatA/TatE family subunit [candidate division Zixibacteria bacterium]HDL04746.1 twin-arginine translocase TatA/TatE family subunit [candidate division Zixibacteria bacterium]